MRSDLASGISVSLPVGSLSRPGPSTLMGYVLTEPHASGARALLHGETNLWKAGFRTANTPLE